MIPLIVILLYLVVIAYIGSIAYRQSKNSTEDFFLASRTIGSVVFFLSLFATNMTAFAILGSSGAAYNQGIGIFGMMAASSAFVIPFTIFFIGTRLWALGKKFGHMTQVQYFRDRWEAGGIGTAIFALSVIMLIPYLIISIMGGGIVLEEISVHNGQPLIQFWLGCLIVAVVVTVNVFFGGMRGVVWVNVFQTILFLLFGTVAVIAISSRLPGGMGATIADMVNDPRTGHLLARERMPAELFGSYFLIPLSSIMFPHMAIMCLSARKMSAFKQTVIAYPIAIMAIWLPCVFLGVVGAKLIPGVENSDTILLKMLAEYTPVWLAGLLGAGIISAVMGSDCHQVLALSTMFTKDIYEYYGGKKANSVLFARIFIIVLTVIAYAVALTTDRSIFELAVQFAFSGFAAMSPVMVGALFWKRSTKWGALASTLYVAFWLLFSGYLTRISDPIAPKPPARAAARPAGAPTGQGGINPDSVTTTGRPTVPGSPPSAAGAPPVARAGGAPARKPVTSVIIPGYGGMFQRTPTTVTFYGYRLVVPMVVGSAILMLLVSLLTPPPSRATIDKYFPTRRGENGSGAVTDPAV
jgi:solute:Na+ symporter, SSS family